MSDMPKTQAQHGIAGLLLHADSQVERLPVPTRSPNSLSSFDVAIQMGGLRARVFMPKSHIPRHSRLPVVLYFHGGGFVLFGIDSLFYHDFCSKVADDSRVIVVSVDYRLAPENRLPAAYEDAVLSLEWLKQQRSCSVLAEHADMSRCFMMGDSAGGNIVHNVAVAGHPSSGFLRGAVLIQPFFGGEKRTQQELDMEHDKYISLMANDTLWKLALPQGRGRDHAYCNPVIELVRRTLRLLVVVGSRDPMYERQLEYVEMVKSAGVDVKLADYGEATHGFLAFNRKPAQAAMVERLLHDLKSFFNSVGASKM